MAKVASSMTLPSSLQLGGNTHSVEPMVKRKTPSELRGEQLRRKENEEVNNGPPLPSTNQMDNGSRKQDLSRIARYVDTRVDGLYPAKKTRFPMLSKKEIEKERSSVERPPSQQQISECSKMDAERRKLPCPANHIASSKVCKDDAMESQPTSAKHSQGKFASVTMLSSGGERSRLAILDLDKALKGLAAPKAISRLPNESSERLDDTSAFGNFLSEFKLPGKKIPLDLTLKTTVRLVSSSSVNWFHRSIMCNTYGCFPETMSVSNCSQGQNITHSAEPSLTSQTLNTKVMHSWVYPQSTLPSSVISVLASATDGVEMDFLRKRQGAWEDSFRSLYFMLRKNICNIFYVCASNFVVMFTASVDMESSKQSCHAYISQSTGSLRSLLKEHDVCFSMPFCHSKVEQASKEDLVELSEIEKHNLGQARRRSTFSDVDNTPQSLLAFSGNENVTGLYEILLNYRSFFTFLAATDVPMLYSPLPFKNAAMSIPEIKCMEIKGADHVVYLNKGSSSKNGDCIQNPNTDVCYSIRIKDTFIPPWITSRICSVMGSEGRSFEVSFTTDSRSIGLNIALDAISVKTVTEEAAAEKSSREISDALGIPETCIAPYLSSGQLKSLNYSNGSYSVSLSHI